MKCVKYINICKYITEWPSGLRRCNQICKVLGSNATRHLVGLRDQTLYKGPGDLQVENTKMQ